MCIYVHILHYSVILYMTFKHHVRPFITVYHPNDSIISPHDIPIAHLLMFNHPMESDPGWPHIPMIRFIFHDTRMI